MIKFHSLTGGRRSSLVVYSPGRVVQEHQQTIHSDEGNEIIIFSYACNSIHGIMIIMIKAGRACGSEVRLPHYLKLKINTASVVSELIRKMM
jgi:hypothetical protein